MAERYKLPKILGEAEVEVVSQPWQGDAIICQVSPVADPSIRLGIARSLLTPVKPPTPEEPEPGTYMLGDWLAFRRPGDTDRSRWFAISTAVDDNGDWDDWEALWRMAGGPDVTITRLVPERVETVELPLMLTALMVGAPLANGDVPMSVRGKHINLSPGAAAKVGRALLAASRAES